MNATENTAPQPRIWSSQLKISAVLCVGGLVLAISGLWRAKNAETKTDMIDALRLQEAITALDSAVHRLLVAGEFGGDDLFEIDRGRLNDAVDRLKNTAVSQTQMERDLAENLTQPAAALLHALEDGDKAKSLESIIRFRETLMSYEASLAETKSEIAPRQDHVSLYLLFAAALTLFAAVLKSLWAQQVAESKAERQLRDLVAVDEESHRIADRLVATDHELSAVRARVELLTTEKIQWESTGEHQRSELQRQMLARSAAERSIGELKSMMDSLKMEHERIMSETATQLLTTKNEMLELQRQLAEKESALQSRPEVPEIDPAYVQKLERDAENFAILRDRMLTRVDELTQANDAAEVRVKQAEQEAADAKYRVTRLEYEFQKLAANGPSLRSG